MINPRNESISHCAKVAEATAKVAKNHPNSAFAAYMARDWAEQLDAILNGRAHKASIHTLSVGIK